MDLAQAATYFADTTLSGWNGTTWVPSIAEVAILPSDRFISKHEFDTHSIYVLTSVETDTLDSYTIVKVDATDQVFMVGLRTFDVQGDVYSKFYLFHRAEKQGELYSFEKTYSASGMAKDVTRQVVGTYYCDVERVTSVGSRQFKSSRFSDCNLFLPSDCPVETSHEIKVDDVFYEISEVYENSGFRVCRAIGKKSV